jgi:hypothetical protein
VDLRQALLADADLRDAYLREANPAGAWLMRAQLAGVQLVGTDLTGADTHDARDDDSAANPRVTSVPASRHDANPVIMGLDLAEKGAESGRARV